MMPNRERDAALRLRSGFTWRSLLGSLYALLIFSPAIIYLSLVTVGVRIGAAVPFCTIIFLAEIVRLTGGRLSRQEATIIYLVASMASATPMFINLIYAEYFVHSPSAAQFNITDKIPAWYAPPISSPVWRLRTFLHPDWIAPIGIRLAATIFGLIAGLSLGFIAREMFIEEWRLPFPIQQVVVQTILNVCERERRSLDIFATSAIGGFIYGLILYAIPFISKAAGYPLTFIPIPWIDFWYYVQMFFPGASFGIATDLMPIAMGLVLSPNICLGIFIGSFSLYFIANWLLVHLGLTMWATRYTPGMNIARIWRESTLTVWACPIIGMGIAAGLVPLFLRPRLLARLFKRIISPSSIEVKERISGPPAPSKLVLTGFILSSAGALLLVWYLVPQAPMHILIPFFFLWSFFDTVVSTMMIGMTGMGFEAPYIKEILIYSSGYTGYDIWFAPFPLTEGTGWVTQFKVCQLSGTTIGSYLKVWLITWVIAMLLSFIFVSSFWSVAPIPSSVYPGVEVAWPVSATYQALWVSRPPGFFHPDWILYSAIIKGLLCVIFHFAKIPLPMISVAVGAGTAIPVAVTIIIGLIIRFILTKIKGEEWYRQSNLSIAAGLISGEGVAAVLGAAIATIVKSTWVRPY